LKAPIAVASGDQYSAQRADVDAEDHRRRRAKSVHQERSGYQWCHDRDASAVGPLLIVKYPTNPVDQHRKTLAAVRRGMWVV
jgi:hypothetical protein